MKIMKVLFLTLLLFGFVGLNPVNDGEDSIHLNGGGTLIYDEGDKAPFKDLSKDLNSIPNGDVSLDISPIKEDVTGEVEAISQGDLNIEPDSVDLEGEGEDKPMPEKLSDPSIVVKKSERILELWDGETLFDVYPIALGFNPVGHKEKEGDGRTPEGKYYVCTRNDKSKYYKSLGVSYPNKEDAQEALSVAFIDGSTYQSIADSIDSQGAPPWKTAMGGEIMIHGHGSHEDWTEGCVAVEDDVMDILWKYCPLKTPISIEP